MSHIAQIDTGDMITATSKLQIQAADVRSEKPKWKSYLDGGMIPQEDFNFITAFERSKGAERAELLEQSRLQCARTFLNLMTNVSKEVTVKYVLTLIDDMLQEDRSRVEIFHGYAKKEQQNVWGAFLNMLNRQDGFIINQTSAILAKIACWSSVLMDGQDLVYYFNFLKDQLRAPGNEYIQTSARCLQMMFRIDEYRLAFVNVSGVPTLVSALVGKANFQLQYQLIFCLWSLTFNPSIAEKVNRNGVVPTLADILSESTKEKVIRIILATFRNLVEKCEDADAIKVNALQMVHCKVLKSLEIIEAKKFDDPDLLEDIELLMEKLHSSVQDVSSFDEYVTEIKSGRLQWSPVHRSDKFWKENAARFNEKNFELIKIIEQLNGKQQVMRLLAHDDPNVRYSALLAVQKIMVHNWEYLGKQMEKEQSKEVSSRA